MFTERYPLDTLRASLLPRKAWHPYPTADERQPWDGLPVSVRRACVAHGEQALGFEWPAFRATYFLEYARTGDRQLYLDESRGHLAKLGDLVLAECIEGQGCFLHDIVNGIWCVCEESYWGHPQHLSMQRSGRGLPDTAEPVVNLYVGETAKCLVWSCYLLASQLDAISPLIRARVEHEVQARVLTPCLGRDDFWWMGLTDSAGAMNNWNAWINSNWLLSVLMIEPDDERRIQAIVKIMRSLDRFIDPYPSDGGCNEGPSYWGHAGASLFDALEWLRSATQGAIDLFHEPLIRRIGQYIYRVHIADRYFLNLADAAPTLDPDGSLIFAYGKQIGDAAMMSFGAYIAQQDPLRRGGPTRWQNLGRTLRALFVLRDVLETDAEPPLLRDVWLEQVQVMAARDRAGSTTGFYLGAKGGHNAESHNHNDVSSFVVYLDGRPLLVDPGVETYNIKTFGPQRYELWTMQSAYHNLPTIDGVMQRDGRRYAAQGVTYSANGDSTLSLDIAAAYPAEANVQSWQRTITLHRAQDVQVTDHYRLSRPVGQITLSLMTPSEVDLSQAGCIVLSKRRIPAGSTAAARVHYDARAFTPLVESVPLSDTRLKPVWGDRLYRILLVAKAPAEEGTWTLRITFLS